MQCNLSVVKRGEIRIVRRNKKKSFVTFSESVTRESL